MRSLLRLGRHSSTLLVAGSVAAASYCHSSSPRLPRLRPVTSHCEGSTSSSHLQTFLSPNFIADAVDAASPSVVNVLSSASIKGFLGPIEGASSGSGFIISHDGFVVTNAHVIANSPDGKVVVTMWNGKKRAAKVHSLDAATDIALVKILDVGIDEELPVATLGSSAKLRPGEFVVALGSPLMLQNSVTFGIVSSTARPGTELGMRKSRLEYVQTDAAINQGNSGGPLCNLDGEVVAINSMKAAGVDGISFAIPIDLAKQIISQLQRSKKVVRPYIGINMVNFNPHAGRKQKRNDALLSRDELQVLVVNVEKGSPADQAGIKGGDILLEVNGQPMRGVPALINKIGVDIGKKLDFRVLRNGDVFNVSITTASAEH